MCRTLQFARRVIIKLSKPGTASGFFVARGYHIWYTHTVDKLTSWEIEYYQTGAGTVPVTEFIDALSPQVKAKFIRSLELLEEYGLLLREPWVRNIRGIPKLREL